MTVDANHTTMQMHAVQSVCESTLVPDDNAAEAGQQKHYFLTLTAPHAPALGCGLHQRHQCHQRQECTVWRSCAWPHLSAPVWASKREVAMASTSSMKMMAGAFSLAILNTSRTIRGPYTIVCPSQCFDSEVCSCVAHGSSPRVRCVQVNA